jgi:cell division septal protein FtsQ
MLRGLGLAVLLLVGGLVVRQARARAYCLPAYRLGPASLHYLGLHPALGPEIEASLRQVPFSVSVFDADAEARIREAIARHPLVAGVQSVEIRYPDRIDVRVAVRQPAAWFRTRDARGRTGLVLVSTDGRLLEPGSYRYYLRRPRSPLPEVVGVRAAPPRLYGQAWEDLPEQVAEGLAAARVAERLYRDFNGTLYVKRIDVAAFPAPPERRRQGEVRFHLHDGTIVEWGRTDRDLDGVAGEDSYATKQARLESQRTHGSGRRGARLDVRLRLRGEGSPLARVR